MKFQEAFDLVFDKLKADNPHFRGFTEETARAMVAAWNVMAIAQENKLDDIAVLAPNTNQIISIPLGSVVADADTKDADGKQESKKKGKKAKESDQANDDADGGESAN